MKAMYIVKFRRMHGARRILRTGTHWNCNDLPDKEFRLELLKDYTKRFLRIESIKRENNSKV